MTDLSKVADSVADVVTPRPLNCPHCQQEIFLHNVAALPDRQIFSIKLESETGSFTARTVGETISNLDRLMKAVAKDIGGKVELFIDSMEKSGNLLSVSFLVTAVAHAKESKHK